MLRAVRILVITIAVLGMTAEASADDVGAKGDIEYGEYLSSECVTCHQASGADKGIPSITGWHTGSFINILKAYREKDLDNATMQLIARRLTDEQIASLALYFGSQPAGWGE